MYNKDSNFELFCEGIGVTPSTVLGFLGTLFSAGALLMGQMQAQQAQTENDAKLKEYIRIEVARANGRGYN